MRLFAGRALTIIVAAVLAAFLVNPAMAQVSGPCGNCHTMHNSQNGEPVAYGLVGSLLQPQSTPYGSLLVTDCVGCHTATDGSTAIAPVTGAPIVNNVVEPTFGQDVGDGKKQGLAAGNFYWVTQDDNYGHNIFSDDSNLDVAPGWTAYCYNDSCHMNLDKPFTPAGPLNGRKACQGCHMVSPSIIGYHHKDDSDGVADSAEEGWYRFLSGHEAGNGHGVSGIEDDDWQLTASATDHNEYLGSEQSKIMPEIMFLTNTMTAYCVGCHGNFHIQNTNPAGTNPWIRHPSDIRLPNSGEYTGYTVYDPLTPVARPNLSGGVSSSVSSANAAVFCLSCHRAHASPYADMLRFPYDQMLAGGGGMDGVGCFKCHSQKDDS